MYITKSLLKTYFRDRVDITSPIKTIFTIKMNLVNFRVDETIYGKIKYTKTVDVFFVSRRFYDPIIYLLYRVISYKNT